MRRKIASAVLQVVILLVLFVTTACLPKPTTAGTTPTTTAGSAASQNTTAAVTTVSGTTSTTGTETSSSTAPTTAVTETSMAAPALSWSIKTTDRTYMAKDGSVVLAVTSSLPSIANASANPAGVKINTYFDRLAQDVLKADEQVATEAVGAYEEMGGDFFAWSDDLSGEVVWQNSDFASTVTSQSNYFGGAHSNTTQSSATFDLSSGEVVPLTSFFKITATQVTNRIVDLVYEQTSTLKDESGILLYDCDEATIREALKLENYYLASQGLVVFFQPYDIAPYAAGLPEFTIPYARLADVAQFPD
jgi:hypothetical protein